MDFNKIAIIGVGLLGGSIGLAMKNRYPHIHVAGIGRTEKNLKKAIELNAIDSYHLDFKRGVEECDLVVIATPISNIVPIFLSILPNLKSDAVVTDVGSTKKVILNEIISNTNGKKHFIGSHPMAGSDRQGVEASTSDLYQQSVIAVINDDDTNQTALEKVETFWKALGGKVSKMTSSEHDEMVAYTSHLPHIMASSLSNTLSQFFSDEKTNLFGNGLLDTTRIAKGDPKIWLDIITSNKKNILDSIKQFKASLNCIEKYIQNNDINKINDYLTKGKIFREEVTLN